MRKTQLAKPKFDYLKFAGGYDTESKPWNLDAGHLRESQNYEAAINGQGYTDIQGYERFDGQAAPSDAIYYIIDVDITGTFHVNTTVTQLVSGATGVIIAVNGDDTPQTLVLTKLTGTFNDSDDLQVSAVTQGTASSTARLGGATTRLLDAQYLNLAADEYRDDIGAVPGSGSILGIHMLNDVWYAFRNNAGDTAADMYKSTASGWTQVALGRELSYTSAGTYEVAEGDTITGATSGATATITRVMQETGSLLAGDGAGRYIFASQTGTFQAEDLDVGGNLNVATIAADSTAITLAKDGRFEMVTENFGGQAGAKRIYGADGVNRGFEFDGSVFCPIETGMTTDTPKHVIVHNKHLFFSFDGSAQHSGLGFPYRWSPIFGAAELATGDTITGFVKEPGSQEGPALTIYNRNTVHMLYGTSALDWNLVQYRSEVGALAYTIQQLDQTMHLDDRGITTFRTAQEFGNFQHATISRHVQRFLDTKRNLATASCIARIKNQYRLFFSDKSALYITTEGHKISAIMPQVFSDAVECITSVEDSTGVEAMMFGSTDGIVYHLDKGTSFDGNNIEAFVKTFFHFSKSIRHLKKYLGVTLEASGSGYGEINFSTELGYNEQGIPQPIVQTEDFNLGQSFWDSFVWDTFIWDGVNLSPSNMKIEGSAENISLVMRKDSDYLAPVNITGAMIRYTHRRQLR